MWLDRNDQVCRLLRDLPFHPLRPTPFLLSSMRLCVVLHDITSVKYQKRGCKHNELLTSTLILRIAFELVSNTRDDLLKVLLIRVEELGWGVVHRGG